VNFRVVINLRSGLWRFQQPFAISAHVFDKVLFSGWKHRGAVFACQGRLRIEKQRLSMRLGKGGGAAFSCTPLFHDAL
jgi:hypothetical protein